MKLEPGTTLLHLRVAEKIGAGGMGEVWRARDTTLDRDVAVKFLPDALASDSERMVRFDREARLLATLNHRNIAAIYGLHRADGVQLLEMELVEGQDLSERLRRGPLPVDQALDIARQIADALEAAHDAGVIHRDLKPANVKLTEDGDVKILDFGLAKAVEPPSVVSAASNESLDRSPTMTSSGTLAGVVLGTAAYMSPEQARGRRVDQRTDIWAFGCVLYEMLTAERCFAGETATETLGAVLHKEVDFDRLPEVPRGVRRAIERCLRRDRRERLHHIGDARIELEDALAGRGVPEIRDDATRRAGRRRRPSLQTIAALGLGLAAGAGGAWGVLHGTGGTGDARELRFAVDHPGYASSLVSNPVLAPDGTWLVYEVQEAGSTRLFLHDLRAGASRALPGTDAGRAPFASPDGRWIGFFTGTSLKKIAVDAGVPVEICEAFSNPGAAWSQDGTIVFSRSWTSGLAAVPAAGGTPRDLTTPAADETGHWAPSFLPDGRRLIYTVFPKQGSLNMARLVLFDLESGESAPLGPGAYATFVPGGYLLYFRAGAYVLTPFDARSARFTGPPVAVLDEVPPVDPEGSRERFVAVSSNGLLAFVGRDDALVSAPRSLRWLTRAGVLERLPLPSRTYNGPAVSPDGRSVAYAVLETGEYDIWLSDVDGRHAERMTRASNNHGAVWRPDGSGFAFISLRLGSFDVFWKNVRSGADPEPLLAAPQDLEPGGFTPDGRRLAVERSSEQTARDVLLLDTETKSLQVLVGSPADEHGAAISPDGRWLAYVSDRSGREEVYVQPLAGGAPVQVSRGGGSEPRWSVGSDELLFVRWPEILVVPWRAEGSRFLPLEPRAFATGEGARFVRERFTGEYSVTDDPDRILVQALDEPLRARVHVIVGPGRELPSVLVSGGGLRR